MKPPLAARSIFLPKSLFAWLAVGAAVCFAGAAAAQDETKVAVVDVSKVFLGYYKAKEFNVKIQEANLTYQNELDNRMQGHHRLIEELARIDKDLDNPALAAPARADRQKQRENSTEQLRKLEQDLQEFRGSRERAIREMTLRQRTQVVEDIMVVLDARIARDHYDLILNKSARGARDKVAVLYANGSLDITDDVLSTLNRNQPAPAGHVPTASPGGG